MAPSSVPSRALLLAFGFVLAASASAVGCGSGTGATGTSNTGGAGGGTGGDTTSSTGGHGGTTSDTGGMGGTGGGGSCDQCLATQCTNEISACDSECVAIQACLDTVCAHLSMLGASDEGDCQVHCQSLHAGAKSKHLALVNCVVSAGCQPPCAGYSYDWDQCVDAQSKGTCKSALDACNGSSDCQSYQACAATCGTYQDCLACASTSGGTAGEKLYEAYWQCVETTCLPDGWLPSF